jgi:primosomal protein N' (replication factor Y)
MNGTIVNSADQIFYAEVIIPSALPQNYTWSVPTHLKEIIQVGSRVEVNLGKRKRYAGIIKSISTKQPPYPTKEILSVLDGEPIVSTLQLKLWEWISNYYMCTEGEVMSASLPAYFKLSSETVLVFNEEFGENFSELDNNEYLIAEALLIKKELVLVEVQQLLDTLNVYPVINSLLKKKVCFAWEALKKNYKPKVENFVLLEEPYKEEAALEQLLNNWSRGPKQMELLLAYLHVSQSEGEVSQVSLLKKSGASAAQLKSLVEKGILKIEKRQVDRIKSMPKKVKIDFELSVAQQQALEQVKNQWKENKVCLLHGVTSSGKTNVYIKLIEEQLQKGKQVLYMLPEIALTSQVIRRLQKHFGGNIGVYHSRFSQNERVEIWNKVKSGELSVVLGARSSVFLPFNNLGLFICDEEHDASYKQQEPAPRYNGRDAGIYLAGMFNAPTLLGSGTPSVESYFNAKNGKYGFVELMTRYNDLAIPPLSIVDTRAIAQKEGGKAVLTPALITSIQEVLERKKQIILFQNRRGYSPYQMCSVCGWIPQCQHCDVSLTFHKLGNKLACHYCGATYPTVHRCAACGSDKFAKRNFGTEKIEEQLQELFPNAAVARMDIDTVRGKQAHDTLIQQFEQGKIDILVGTQMVVKGLDFENVDLVGILDADGLLHFADFRVNERAFQLMEQVSGRAGRKEETGKVIVQSSQPKHPVLQQVVMHNYTAFFNYELEHRKEFFYPPFSRLIRLTFKHKSKDVVDKAAAFFGKSVAAKYGAYMIGPAEPVIGRVRNLFLMELLFKLPRKADILREAKSDLLEMISIMHQQKSFASVNVIADVDLI